MGWVLMSEREVHRIEVLSCVVERSMTVAHAAAVLCLSERQVQRLLKIFREEGAASIRHKARGRPSHNRIRDGLRAYTMAIMRDRYAPDQFHATAAIPNGELAQLIAGGGVVGRVDAAHAFMIEPTVVRPISLLTDAHGAPVNVETYALPKLRANQSATVIGVFGASMNSGKTTAASSLAHGLKRAGFATFGVKATGTGAFGDDNSFADAGVAVLDFTDVGMATTYRMPMARIEAGFETLIATAAAGGAEVIVVEIADGVFQQEARAILKAGAIRDRMDGILFAAPDALSALGGVYVLEKLGLSPFAISGKVSSSPLARAEAEEVTGLPVLSREDLWDAAVIHAHVAPMMRHLRSQSAA